MQNKYDIRNQHKKLHQKLYILAKYIFHQNPTCTLPQYWFFEFCPEVPYGPNFSGKYVLLKYKVFDVVFYADSEYRIYFALKPCFGG
jgi:hypothetical protein